MERGTKEAIEAGAIVLAIAGLAFYVMRSPSQVIIASPQAAQQQPNVPINHDGENGDAYFNYNYPAVQGWPVDLSAGQYDNSATTPCKTPTCGCTDTQLLGDNAEFQRYLQARLTGFIDQYEKDVLSFLPSWFTQYLYNTGPGLSHLPAINISGGSASKSPFTA